MSLARTGIFEPSNYATDNAIADIPTATISIFSRRKPRKPLIKEVWAKDTFVLKSFLFKIVQYNFRLI